MCYDNLEPCDFSEAVRSNLAIFKKSCKQKFFLHTKVIFIQQLSDLKCHDYTTSNSTALCKKRKTLLRSAMIWCFSVLIFFVCFRILKLAVFVHFQNNVLKVNCLGFCLFSISLCFSLPMSYSSFIC